MTRQTEASARIKVDALLDDAGWNLTDGSSVLPEYSLPDGTQADYVLCDRQGHPVAVIEAKRESIDPITAQDQGQHYAEQLNVPFVFLSNGEKVLFLDREYDAHAREIAGFYAQDDIERRIATRKMRRVLSSVTIDRKIVDRDYQLECVEKLSSEVTLGRRKMLVEMATGTGKTRTAAAFIKRLFESGIVTRVLFLVDRIELARQAEGTFTDHLRDYPCHVLRPSRRFDRTKRITIASLQSMISDYRNLSPGYFDLIITDECHRSIYGKWSIVLRHFDGIQLGLTATICKRKETLDQEDNKFVRDTLRFFELEEPTFIYDLQTAIREKHLVPYHIYKAMTVKTAAKDGFEVNRDELDWDAMDNKTREELTKLFASSNIILVDPNTLERKFTIPERNRAMVREFRNVITEGFVGRDGVTHQPKIGKTIVFAVTKKHAETLAYMLDQRFADLKPHPHIRFADFVVSDIGGGPAPDAKEIIDRFKEEQFPMILVSVNMLDTGFDCPEVENLVMARFTRSGILYRQMRGRGTRKAPNIGKTSFTIFDFVGVTDLHDDDGDFGEISAQPGGQVIGPSTPQSLLQLDVDDHIDPESRDWLTLDERGRIVRSPKHEECAARYGLRFEAWIGKRDDFDAQQSRWANLIGSRVKTEALRSDKFDELDFDEHPFRSLGGYEQASRVFGGQQALNNLVSEINTMIYNQQ